MEPLLKQAKAKKKQYAAGSKARYIPNPFDPASNPPVPSLPIPGPRADADNPDEHLHVPGPTPGFTNINTAPSGPPTQMDRVWMALTDLKERFEENAAFPQTPPRARKTVNSTTCQWNRRRGARNENRTDFLVCLLDYILLTNKEFRGESGQCSNTI